MDKKTSAAMLIAIGQEMICSDKTINEVINSDEATDQSLINRMAQQGVDHHYATNLIKGEEHFTWLRILRSHDQKTSSGTITVINREALDHLYTEDATQADFAVLRGMLKAHHNSGESGMYCVPKDQLVGFSTNDEEGSLTDILQGDSDEELREFTTCISKETLYYLVNNEFWEYTGYGNGGSEFSMYLKSDPTLNALNISVPKDGSTTEYKEFKADDARCLMGSSIIGPVCGNFVIVSALDS